METEKDYGRPYFREHSGYGARHSQGGEFIEKDAKRFPDDHGWGYAVFNYDPTSDKFAPATAADRPPQRMTPSAGSHAIT